MRVLFVTSRNVINTCGELRLIKNRAEVLETQFNVTTDYLVLRSDKVFNRAREEVVGKGIFWMTTFPKKIPFLFFSAKYRLKRKVREELRKREYSCVVLSGAGVISMTTMVRLYGAKKVLIDMHGALEELVEFKDSNICKNIVKRIFYYIAKHDEKYFIPKSDGLVVVSNSLMNYVKEKYGVNDLPFFIVPCASKRTFLDKNLQIAYREKYRRELKLSPEDILFVYSGGVSPWQNIEGLVGLFVKLNRMITNRNAKLLILSPHKEVLNKYANSVISVKSVSSLELSKVLCAGDFAFLLRDDCITNNVAFPNKFIEYVSSGMRIIATPYIYDIKAYLDELSIGVLYDHKAGSIDRLCKYLMNDVAYADDLPVRQKFLDDMCFENTLIPLVAWLGEKT